MEMKREDAQYSPVAGEHPSLGEQWTKPSRKYLYISVAILNLQFLMCGTAFGWSSPMLMKLELSATDGSTIASALPLGIVLGPFVSGVLLDRIGRKATVGLSMGIITCCYVILTLVSSVSLLSLGRFMAGVTCGITFASVPLYIAEISEDSVRGFLNTMNQFSVGSGSLLMYAVGPLVSYAYLHYMLLGLCATFFVLFPLLPDSPYSLVTRGKVTEAERTLAKLRGNSSVSLIEKELQVIQKSITEGQEGSTSVRELVSSRGNRLALTICLVLLVSQQLCGVSIVFLYLEQIFQMTGTNISSSTCSTVVGFILVISGGISPLAVKYFGYKKPLLVSTSGMALGMGNLGAYLAMKFYGVNVTSFNWLPLLSVVVYIVSFNIGFANIPWALAGELFPNNVKSNAVTMIASTSGLFAFLTVKLFPYLTLLLGLHFLFCVCSLMCLLTVVFMWLVVQDTSSMSFVEIQLMLNGHKRIDLSLNKPLKSPLADVEL
ncbi:facilitated trehalose transporter Tret1-like [Homalodisca vitripennis]|uniref:facilitated trehalose transporter Tret1-like n=1 Tax=Homalodisca vitripennis TaxID=197043 RepID=UPI001EEC472D|nr:facilitated trehalose transporter Tret1-like [Homalodisca vitripennis]